MGFGQILQTKVAAAKTFDFAAARNKLRFTMMRHNAVVPVLASAVCLLASSSYAFSPMIKVGPRLASPFLGGTASAFSGGSALRPGLCTVRRGQPGSLGLRAQIKFADAVEEILKRRFAKNKVPRVIKSWRR